MKFLNTFLLEANSIGFTLMKKFSFLKDLHKNKKPYLSAYLVVKKLRSLKLFKHLYTVLFVRFNVVKIVVKKSDLILNHKVN